MKQRESRVKTNSLPFLKPMMMYRYIILDHGLQSYKMQSCWKPFTFLQQVAHCVLMSCLIWKMWTQKTLTQRSLVGRPLNQK